MKLSLLDVLAISRTVTVPLNVNCVVVCQSHERLTPSEESQSAGPLKGCCRKT